MTLPIISIPVRFGFTAVLDKQIDPESRFVAVESGSGEVDR